MTPVSPSKLPVMSVHLSQMNSLRKFKTGNVTLKNKWRKLVAKIMNLIFWAKATGIPSLAQMQTSRVLLTIFSPPPPPPPPPRPQPLAFSSLSLKTPAKSVPPTPGTALQQKIQTNIEKSLGDSLNIPLQQQMGSFQASMLEAFQSLREELTAKKANRGGSDLVSCFQTWYIQS